MVGRAMLFFVMCAGLLLMSCSKNPTDKGGGAPAITTQPVSQTVNEGSSVSLTVVATGDPAPTYQWQRNGNDIANATSATYTIASAVVSNTGNYRVVVTNSAGSVTSNEVTLIVNPTNPTAPAIVVQPQSLTLDPGSSATFTVVATGNPTPTYQWRKNNVAIPGATSASYTIASVTQGDAGTYTVYISNGVLPNVTSNGAVLTVNQAQEGYPYTVSGNTMTVYRPEEIGSWSYCSGGYPDTLVTQYDTSYADTMVFTYNVSGNTLTLDMGGGQPATLTRVGSGTGLIGSWTPNDTGYDLPDTLIFTATTVYGSGNNDCNASEWINYQWPGYSAGFNGTAVELSCTQVLITGNTTGEQVGITWNSNGDMTYTSTEGTHDSHTWYENPTLCPNPWQPSWWWTFINGNAPTPAAKKAVRPSVPPMKRHPKRSLFR